MKNTNLSGIFISIISGFMHWTGNKPKSLHKVEKPTPPILLSVKDLTEVNVDCVL